MCSSDLHFSEMRFGWKNSADSFFFKATETAWGDHSLNFSDGSLDFSTSFTLSQAVKFNFSVSAYNTPFGPGLNDAQNHVTLALDGNVYANQTKTLILDPGVHTAALSIRITSATGGKYGYAAFGAYLVPEAHSAAVVGAAATTFAACQVLRGRRRPSSNTIDP